ncbi:MAG: DUF1934 domain-containing protein [Clostridiaceae bacterium]|nr:DUF1934 domain-containing protein [Clostridiaceae bacterium]
MKSQNATIMIRTTQHDISEEAVLSRYSGKYAATPDTHLITYQEYLDVENAMPLKCSSLIKIQKDYISISKKGAITTEMQFSLEKDFQGPYQTPLGTFQMNLHTESLASSFYPDKISTELIYFLCLNNCPISKYTIQIEIHPD